MFNNSDVYDNWVNPLVAGNGGGVNADGPPLHGLAASAALYHSGKWPADLRQKLVQSQQERDKAKSAP